MRNSPTVTFPQLYRAALVVQRELRELKTYLKDGLADVEVYWCSYPIITLPTALGIFVHEASWLETRLGYKPGHIYVPQRVLTDGFWRNRGSLRDVLRHEYAHGLAHYYPDLVGDRRFERTFGGGYWEDASGYDLPDEDYVSDYAKTMPMEDFAETFMTYVRQKGTPPKSKQTSKAFLRKWYFIEWSVHQVSGGKVLANPIA